MCGFVGIFRTSSSQGPLSESLLQEMRDTMIHRGPDDAGLYISPQNDIGLAHRRLSIIDLSPSARQPMSNDDETIWIIFNGEIYNHAEIRSELEKLGFQFKTDHSDTEVILRGYEKWGRSILSRLRGMFAFSIWDKKKEQVWLVRDRIGIKPLYYTYAQGMFLFASEIKALLKYPSVKKQCDDQSFYDFLTFLVSPAPRSLFKNIFKIPAGHTLTINKSGKQVLDRYWNPFDGIHSFSHRSEKEWTENLLSELRESIRYRMISDVNFGVFLSGGIDSSTNVALMAELMDKSVQSFSIGYKGDSPLNELHYAQKVVDRYKTNHHEIKIGPEEMKEFLPKLVHHQDEPIVDPVCIPVYFVSKLAKESGTTVCQVGEGADELFSGYPYWKLIQQAQPWVSAYQWMPKSIRAVVWSGLNSVWYGKGKSLRVLEMARRASFGEEMFWGGAEAYQETAKQRFLSNEFKSSLNGYTSYQPIKELRKDFERDAPPGADQLHWMTYLDLRLRLPELLLMRVDKMTMANSVESRVPFLDHKFVQLAMSMPKSIKFKNNTLKYILKKAVEPILPHDVIYRKKQGFAVPVDDWFKDSLREWTNDKIIDFSKRTNYFNRSFLPRYLNSTSSKHVWFLLNFVLWHEKWIEN